MVAATSDTSPPSAIAAARVRPAGPLPSPLARLVGASVSPLPTRRIPTVALALVCALSAVATSACSVGVDAETNLQGPSGDGATVDTGSLNARGLLLVMAPDGKASLVGTLVNLGDDADAITSVTVAGATTTISEAGATTIPLPARTSVQIGYLPSRVITATGLPAEFGRFVAVTLKYQTAGTADVDVVTVPATGVYEGLGPVEIAR